jgi:hypothetical protein
VIIEGIVCYSCLTFRHRRRDWEAGRGLFEVALRDGRRFFARAQPRLFDAHNQRIPPYDITEGSNVKISVEGKWMDAVQVVSAVDDSPFTAVG